MYYDKRLEVPVEAPQIELTPIQKHLLAAADYIREHGWCQKSNRNIRGNVCLVGSLYYTARSCGFWDHCEGTQKMRKFLKLDAVADWNDLPGRTKEEVIAALEGAAKTP